MAGFTLTEILMVVTIIGVLAGSAVLPQLRTLEASKRRSALTILEAIYAGERVRAVTNSDRYCPAPGGPPACTWDEIYVDDPANVIPGVAFSVSSDPLTTPPYNAFVATAARTGGLCNGRVLTVNQTRTVGGDWPENGNC